LHRSQRNGGTGSSYLTFIAATLLAVLRVLGCIDLFVLTAHFFKDYPAAKAAIVEADRERFSAQANAFEAGLPSAHVVRLPNASHYVFKSNEADVIREMNAFLSKLP